MAGLGESTFGSRHASWRSGQSSHVAVGAGAAPVERVPSDDGAVRTVRKGYRT